MRILTVDLTARSRRTDEPVPPGWAADDLLIEAVRPSELAWACADLQPEAVVVTTDSAGRADAFLVRSLREDEVGVPVLVIAAEADGESLVASLEAGADDVVPSPSTPIEIRARLRALARRPRTWMPDLLTNGPLEVDVLGHRAADDGQELELTAQQFRLLTVLMRNPGRVMSRDQLLAAAWDPAQEVSSNVVEQSISGLRARLPRSGSALRTVRGIGYRLDRLDHGDRRDGAAAGTRAA